MLRIIIVYGVLAELRSANKSASTSDTAGFIHNSLLSNSACIPAVASPVRGISPPVLPVALSKASHGSPTKQALSDWMANVHVPDTDPRGRGHQKRGTTQGQNSSGARLPECYPTTLLSPLPTSAATNRSRTTHGKVWNGAHQVYVMDTTHTRNVCPKVVVCATLLLLYYCDAGGDRNFAMWQPSSAECERFVSRVSSDLQVSFGR